MIRVEKPGLLSSVQDLGRPGQAHLGISASGAADALALRIGNLLCGNDDGAAAIEMTLLGATFVFEADAVVVLAGSDFGSTLDGEPVPLWAALAVRAGQRLACGPTRGGARAYLCVRGGIQVPLFLGSASTHLQSGLGGHRGRALAAGDVLTAGAAPATPPRGRADTRWIRALYADGPFRVTPGPQADAFAPAVMQRLLASAYSVREESNRMGIRLQGPRLETREAGSMLTEGVSLGAVQVPESGQPIILFVEHQTTGGYPKIANVCSADLHRLGQLRPRDRVRFEPLSFAAARRLVLDIEAGLERLRGAP